MREVPHHEVGVRAGSEPPAERLVERIGGDTRGPEDRLRRGEAIEPHRHRHRQGQALGRRRSGIRVARHDERNARRAQPGDRRGRLPEGERRGRQEPRGHRRAREGGDPGLPHVLEVIGGSRAELGAELGAADVGELADVHAHLEPRAPRRFADRAPLVDPERIRVDVGIDEAREALGRDLRHELVDHALHVALAIRGRARG